MKKQLVALLAVIATACTFAGCKGKDGDTSIPDSSVIASSDSANSDSTNVTPPATTYSIHWMNENGVEITTTTVEENTAPQYTYTVTDTQEWDYTFNGWSASANGDVLSELPAATGDATYYAIVSKVKKQYTVTFDSNGGSSIPSQTITYGELATTPEKPTLEGCKFAGWVTEKNGSVAVDFNTPITQNVTYYAVWNETLDLKSMLNALLSGYELNPLTYIPESMQISFSNNLVQPSNIVTDYSSAVNVANITYGYGEQWHMVVDNLQQTQLFFNTLTVVEGLTTTSITAFNNYFDSNPSDTARHEFTSGIYNVTIDFDGEVMSYVLDYTAELPILGEQVVQIALSMDAETGEKSARIQLGDANALTYTLTENSYEFAIKYLGARKAMFSIEKNEDGNVTGKIYEFLTVAGLESGSAAEFNIDENYVSVVGNKADGMVGFTGYINELYDVETGTLIAYEVKEELSKLVFNTLWFNLNDIAGINTIKYIPATENTDTQIFINGSSKIWKSKNISLLNFSRRFDIEFRTQYVYSYNASEGTYTEHAISVPMMFVQEEQMGTFVEDVADTNNVTVAISISSSDLTKLMDDYDTLIPIFAENKDAITADMIIAYIGDKKIFN